MGEDKLILTVKRFKGEDGYRSFSVRLKESLVNRIDTLASVTERSRNELIGLSLEFALEHYKLEQEDHYVHG